MITINCSDCGGPTVLRTAAEVATMFGISPRALTARAQRRPGVGHHVGDITLYGPADIEALRENLTSGPKKRSIDRERLA